MSDSSSHPPNIRSSKGGHNNTPLERMLRQNSTRPASFRERVLQPAIQGLADRTGTLYDAANLDNVRFRLMQAGFPMGLRARDFMALKLIGLCVFPALMTLYVPILGIILQTALHPIVWLWVILLGAWLGWRAPDIWLATAIKNRKMEIQLILPDMIDLITISVEAGLGLYAAIQRVSSRFDNPLSEEFLRSIQEARLGRTNSETLRDLGRRVDLEDVSMLISALVQAELLGVPVANVLRVQSERLRDKRRQRAREQAQKAPLKMLFPLVFFIFPALFVVILGPAALRIMDSSFF
jgi:tight adherence protein C